MCGRYPQTSFFKGGQISEGEHALHSLLERYRYNNLTPRFNGVQQLVILCSSKLNFVHISTKVMCNGNDYISKVMVMVMITFLKRV